MSSDKRFHFSQVFDLNVSEEDLDFFDTNLKYDTPLFIDPFLLKNSQFDEDKKLFERYGAFIKKSLIELQKIDLNNARQKKFFLKYITFGEPQQIYLGFTAASNKGSGPSHDFAKSLFNFYIDNSLKKLIESEDLYPQNKINPVIFELLADKIGPDGISDMSACLILDFLITYTQDICRENRIKTYELPIPRFYNFVNMEWVEGGYRMLPKNPFTGESIILVPKRFLRASEISRDTNITRKVQQILSLDPDLSVKFADFIDKQVSKVDKEEIRSILKENVSVLKKILDRVEKDNPGSYDFVSDPSNLLAIKKFYNLYNNEPIQVLSCEDLLSDLKKFLNSFQDYILYNGGWTWFWKKKKGAEHYTSKCKEEVLGRQLHAMGYSWYRKNNDITFCNEVSNGNGFVDFFLVYKECRIVIEIKLLSNSAISGDAKIPAYIHGIKYQLPEYAKQHRAKYAFYITGQHYSNKDRNDSNRVAEIKKIVPEMQIILVDEIENFEKLEYMNINISTQKTPSKK